MDEQDNRIASILNAEDVPEVNDTTLKIYLQYIKENVDPACELTGIEDFDWEEYYILGPGDKKEHEELRKTNPSYMDRFKMLSLYNDPDGEYGILVNLRRISDNKKFTLPLADLQATAKNTMSYQILDDYSVWFVNY